MFASKAEQRRAESFINRMNYNMLLEFVKRVALTQCECSSLALQIGSVECSSCRAKEILSEIGE